MADILHREFIYLYYYLSVQFGFIAPYLALILIIGSAVSVFSEEPYRFWPAVIAVVLITYPLAEWLTGKIVSQGDSFRAVVTINILCSIFFISIFLTIIGTWNGTKAITMYPLRNFMYIWPRNAVIAFFVEALIAQPAARQVMVMIHRKQDERA